MRLVRSPLIVATTLLLAACGGAEKVGGANYAPLVTTGDVPVFTLESQIKQPFEVVGNISYSDPGRMHRLTLNDAVEPLQAKARELKANGVIIDSSESILTGIYSRGISVEGRAIRLLAKPAEAAPQRPAQDATQTPRPAAAAAPQGSARDPAETLRQLRKLHDDGLITDREYADKKAEVLRRM